MASELTEARFRSALDALSECVQTCTACANECIRGVDASMVECARLCLDCAQVCATCVRLLAADSSVYRQYCGLCAEICEACAAECGKFDIDHCQVRRDGGKSRGYSYWCCCLW